MNIPPNLRQKILQGLFVTVGVLAICYAVVQVGVGPLLDSRRSARKQLEELRAKLDRAQVEFAVAETNRLMLATVCSTLTNYSARYILHPLLGSYQLSAQDIVDAAARSAGVKVEPVREIGVQALPGKSLDKAEHAFKTYTVSIDAMGGYEQLTGLIAALEEGNPFLRVTEMSIAGQTENPEIQRLSVQVQWPVWANTANDPLNRVAETNAPAASGVAAADLPGPNQKEAGSGEKGLP